MNQLTDEYKFETFADPPGEADGVVAFVCDTADAAKAIQDELPEGHQAYGVLEAVGGARFKDIEFHFDFALPRYQSKRYRKDFLDALHFWPLHVRANDVEAVEQRIECIKVALDSM